MSQEQSAPSASNSSSDYYENYEQEFLEALGKTSLPGDLPEDPIEEDDWKPPPSTQPGLKRRNVEEDTKTPPSTQPGLKHRYVEEDDEAPPSTQPGLKKRYAEEDDCELPPPTQPGLKRRFSDEEEEFPPPGQPGLKRKHVEDDNDEVYGASKFGGFGEYMKRKRAKLQVQNQRIVDDDEGIESDIFKGISIYVNGHTDPSVQELRRLIMKHGGTFQPYLVRKSSVTHIITCSLTAAKMHEFQNMKVVTPEWITDSIDLQVLLPWRDFIYQPEERDESAQGSKSTQTKLNMLPPTKVPQNDQPVKTVLPPPPAQPVASSSTSVPAYAAHGSNPNAKRAMANPQWRAAHTSAAGSDFIEGYYKNSRLHHLSTWKSELRELVKEAQRKTEAANESALSDVPQKVAAEMEDFKVPEGISMRGADLALRSPTKQSKEKGKGKARAEPEDSRVIMHCDFDAFFVSASLTKHPHLQGKPVVVCHSQGGQGGVSSTSEIASASYEARAFGIKNGMSLQQARQLCPDVMTVPYEFELYKQYSLKFYTILMSQVDDLQAVSVDEALIEVTTAVEKLRNSRPSAPDFDPAKELAETLRTEVKKATGCEISIGIAHNILLARLATRRAKPAASYHLLPENIAEFISDLKITDLWGFGASMKKKAEDKLGTIVLGELVSKSKGALCDALGKSLGERLYNAIRGIDHSKLESDKPRKSVSCEINYGIRFGNNQEAEQFVLGLAEEVSKRLRDIGMVGGSITLKIMKRDPTAPVEAPKFLGHGACDVFNKQAALTDRNGKPTSDVKAIGQQAWKMLKAYNFDPKELRGIGIQIQKLEPPIKPPPPNQASLPTQWNKVRYRPREGPPPPVPTPVEMVRANPRPMVPVSVLKRPQLPLAAPAPKQPPPKKTDPLDLPSFSQVDMSVYNELPDDIRKELEGEFERRSKSKSEAPRVRFEFPPPKKRASFFPEKRPRTNYSRIAQQFNPPGMGTVQREFPVGGRGRGGRGRGRGRGGRVGGQPADWFVGIMGRTKTDVGIKLKGTKSTRLSDDDIRKMGYDPDVFKELPPRIRAEQLCRLRLIRDHGAVPEVSGERKIIKPKKRKPNPHAVYLPPPDAKHPEVAVIKRPAAKKGDPLPVFSETADIQKIVGMWVDTNQESAPDTMDVRYLTNFLLKSTETRVCGGTGLEKAIAVLKWWLVLLRRNWGAYELGDPVDDYLDEPQFRVVARAWWDAFNDVKKQMDVVSRKRFGGKLSLK